MDPYQIARWDLTSNMGLGCRSLGLALNDQAPEDYFSQVVRHSGPSSSSASSLKTMLCFSSRLSQVLPNQKTVACLSETLEHLWVLSKLLYCSSNSVVRVSRSIASAALNYRHKSNDSIGKQLRLSRFSDS